MREVTEKLSELYPGSQIDLRVQFLELTEDQKLVDILDEEDILTVFKKDSTEKEEITKDTEKDFFVVMVSEVTRKRVFLWPAVLSGLDLTKLAHNKIITVFRSVKNATYSEYSDQDNSQQRYQRVGGKGGGGVCGREVRPGQGREYQLYEQSSDQLIFSTRELRGLQLPLKESTNF